MVHPPSKQKGKRKEKNRYVLRSKTNVKPTSVKGVIIPLSPPHFMEEATFYPNQNFP